MTQPSLLDFAPNLPIAGKTPRIRHASFTGARRAAIDRPILVMAYIALLRTLGPMSDQAAAKALGRETCSINSTRGGLGTLVIDSGAYETKVWPDGGTTKRTKWMVAP